MMDKNSTPTVHTLQTMVDYQEGAIVSRTLLKRKSGTITLFAFDKDEALSEHTSPYAALIQVFEGTADVRIEGETFNVKEGELINLPPDKPHAVYAKERFKMMLSMIRS